MAGLLLYDENLLAKGTQRYCYQHPSKSNKVIKILRNLPKRNRSNDLDYLYYNHLQKKNVSQKQIAQCFGYVDTNLGKGLVFEKVLNADGSEAISLDQMIKNKQLSNSLQRELAAQLIEYLEENQILFFDVVFSNIFCRKRSNGRYELVIIDGLGARKLDYRYWLYIGIGWYRRRKIRNRAKKLLSFIAEA